MGRQICDSVRMALTLLRDLPESLSLGTTCNTEYLNKVSKDRYIGADTSNKLLLTMIIDTKYEDGREEKMEE